MPLTCNITGAQGWPQIYLKSLVSGKAAMAAAAATGEARTVVSSSGPGQQQAKSQEQWWEAVATHYRKL